MGITLKQHQKDGMLKALAVKNSLMCMKVGEGKTFVALFTLRKLIKDGVVKKGIVFCTKTSVVPFMEDLEKVTGREYRCIETDDDFFKALKGDEKIILVKHSMLEKLGYNSFNVDALRDYTRSNPIMAIIDEAHKIQNIKGVAHTSWDNIRPYFEKTMLLTATPYSSELTQLYGMVSLIYPKLWKSEAKFKELYIDELMVRDRSGRVLRKEILRYKNLSHLRETLEPFTFFWFPPVKLNFANHITRLKDYTEYDNLCLGVMEDEEEE